MLQMLCTVFLQNFAINIKAIICFLTEVCLSKSARDAALILLRAFAHWGLPEEIICDNARAVTSFLYRLLLAMLQVKVALSSNMLDRFVNPDVRKYSAAKLWALIPHMLCIQGAEGRGNTHCLSYLSTQR